MDDLIKQLDEELEPIYNKILGQIRGYIESKKLQYDLTSEDTIRILDTIITEQEDYCNEQMDH